MLPTREFILKARPSPSEPKMGLLPDATRIGVVDSDAPAGAPSRQPSGIGVVDLNVRDVDAQLGFYRDVLGYRERSRAGNIVELGAASTFLRLHHAPDAPARKPRQAGLYHVAYLLPTRADLGALIQRMIELRHPVQGASDHMVSEALYLADPEGNGIEIYADRPRASWRGLDQSLKMGTQPMDVEDVLASADGARWSGAPDGLRVGHVHLQVNDVLAAERFYRDVVGFEVQASMGSSASFLSAGGYHHHVAVNAWGTQGGPAADPRALGLREYEILVPAEGYEDLIKRVGGERASDPAGNVVRLVRA